MSNQCISHSSFSPSLRKVDSCQNHIKSFYGETTSLQSSLLGQVLLGERLDGNGKNVIKMCMKEMQQTLRDRILEDPRTEISVMEKVCTNKHPNFVQLMDATEDHKLYCTIQEYVQDGDLCTYIQNNGGLELERSRRIIKQIVNATKYLHENNYCHLDLSLENILIDLKNDIIKLCDFGLCRKLNHHHTNKKFAPSMIRPGKPGYTSPEIFNYQSFDGCKSDVWSIGVMIFILLTGFPPFTRPHLNDRCFAYIFGRDCNDLFNKWNLQDKVPILARDLLNQIFVIEEKRISILEMLQHPFLLHVEHPKIISSSLFGNELPLSSSETMDETTLNINHLNINNNLTLTNSFISTTCSINETITLSEDYDDKYLQEKEPEPTESSIIIDQNETTQELDIMLELYQNICNEKSDINNNNENDDIDIIYHEEINEEFHPDSSNHLNNSNISNNSSSSSSLRSMNSNTSTNTTTTTAIENSDCKCCYHSPKQSSQPQPSQPQQQQQPYSTRNDSNISSFQLSYDLQSKSESKCKSPCFHYKQSQNQFEPSSQSQLQFQFQSCCCTCFNHYRQESSSSSSSNAGESLRQ